jgi:hypothetical protein
MLASIRAPPRRALMSGSSRECDPRRHDSTLLCIEGIVDWSAELRGAVSVCAAHLTARCKAAKFQLLTRSGERRFVRPRTRGLRAGS